MICDILFLLIIGDAASVYYQVVWRITLGSSGSEHILPRRWIKVKILLTFFNKYNTIITDANNCSILGKGEFNHGRK